MRTSDGSTQKISGRHNNRRSQDESGGLGTTRRYSSLYGIQPVRPLSANCSGENTVRTISEPGSGDTVKVLKRLEIIEKTFLDYVRGQQNRFEAHLIESKAVETSFLQIVTELKQEIYDLASKENTESQ